MSRPSYDDVWTFSRSVQHVSQEARNAFLAGARQIDFADWTMAAQQLKELVFAVMNAYGPAASELGAQWYEFCRAGNFNRGYTAIVGETSRYSIKSDIDAAVDMLFNGEITEDELIDKLAGVVVNQTHGQARNTIMVNLDEDLRQARIAHDTSFIDDCGYARVTTAGACAFCVLLASRGFVYRSKRTASRTKFGDKYHDDCRCVPVPFTDAHEISGYGEQLEEHERKYREADNLRRSGKMPDELKDRIKQAREQHDIAYAEGRTTEKWSSLNEDTIVMRWQNEGMH